MKTIRAIGKHKNMRKNPTPKAKPANLSMKKLGII